MEVKIVPIVLYKSKTFQTSTLINILYNMWPVETQTLVHTVLKLILANSYPILNSNIIALQLLLTHSAD